MFVKTLSGARNLQGILCVFTWTTQFVVDRHRFPFREWQCAEQSDNRDHDHTD